MKEILIKKYDNRRLYCVEEARYVSLAEIKEFLQRGDRVRVIEKSTGKDITKYILMQVMLEERYELLPMYFYQMVLQSPKEVVETFFQQFFPQMMEMFNNYQQNSSFSPMGFKNPWMQNNPFLFANPFMNANTGKTRPKEEDENNEKMAEILKRLRELEEKLQSD
ncbi:MAG: hypothetical protein Kow0029_24420 [Candidatus Rifleibacteriota bacterium]